MSRALLGSRRQRRSLVASFVLRGIAAALMAGCAVSASHPVAVIAHPSGGGWQQELSGTSIGDVISRPALRLLDTSGATFDLRNRPAGTVTLLFFGYTHCPDTCPTTMADLAAALRGLDVNERRLVEVVFVTEDPSRDSPPLVRQWLDQFNGRFIGLTGGGDRTASTIKALKAPASAFPTGSRDVDHTGNVYAFAGQDVVVYTGGTTPKQYAHDLRLLLRHL